jgi:hypothetical protein
MALRFPLIAWGTPDPVGGAGWTPLGTPSRLTGQPDPFGGTDAVLVGDDDGAAFEGYYRAGGVARFGRADLEIFVLPGTSSTHLVQVRETVGSTIVGFFRVTTSGTPVFTAGSGTWTTFGATPVGLGFYLLVATLEGLAEGTPLAYEIFPAGASAAATGNATFYLRNAILLDVAKGPRAWATPRAGTERVRGPDGGRDAWVTGWDNRFAADFTLIPPKPRVSPALVSGWDGGNEAVGVNAGVAAMLAEGRKKGLRLTFVPDRSNCAVSIASELMKPWDEAPSPGRIGDRAISLALRNPTTAYPLAA